MLVSRTFNEHTLKSSFIMELITDLHLLSEGEKATWLKLNVWLMVFSRVSYSKVFYLMFFLQ